MGFYGDSGVGAISIQMACFKVRGVSACAGRENAA
jgi:hypothetical protein